MMDLKKLLQRTRLVSFAEKVDLKRPAVATRERALGITWASMQRLPNPDPVLRKLGRSITAYRDLAADAHVGGCIRRRKAAVTSLAYGLDRGQASARAHKNMEAILADLPLKDIIKEMLEASFYGYQPMEITWAAEGGFIVPAEIVGKPPEWFCFDNDNQLRFLAQDAGIEGELVDPQKFLLVRQDASYNNPYGVADLSRCYWPTHFKRGGFDFWIKFLEKFGTPWVVGKVPPGTDDADVEDLLTNLQAMAQDAVAAIPSDSSVEIIEAAGKGASGDLHERFLRFCRSEVSIALLGQDQTTEANSNRASATAGLEVTEDIRDDDASMVESAMNALVRRLHDLNFTGPAPVWKMWEDSPGDKELAERDSNLQKAGANFTKQYFMRAYQLQREDLADAAAAPATSTANFAEGDQPAPAQQREQQAAAKVEKPLAQWIDQIRELVDKAQSLEEIRDGLEQLLPDLTLDGYAEAMAEALAAAALAGRYDILQEVAGGGV